MQERNSDPNPKLAKTKAQPKPKAKCAPQPQSQPPPPPLASRGHDPFENTTGVGHTRYVFSEDDGKGETSASRLC